MPTLDDVYCKFGFTSEAAQLLETELGTMLLSIGAIEAGLFDGSDPARASDLLTFVNRQTLGQLLKSLNRSTDSLATLEGQLSLALKERNRLSHSFYRQHNFRRNSEPGRTLMLEDLESIHTTLLDAYKAVMLLSGVDLDSANGVNLPTTHVPI
ncbi:hypothetical protein [Usitatibacter rugosus]|nr:hypothetical protein [Usitatibacter rugosus]